MTKLGVFQNLTLWFSNGAFTAYFVIQKFRGVCIAGKELRQFLMIWFLSGSNPLSMMAQRENAKTPNCVVFCNGVMAKKGDWIITTESGEKDICQITSIQDQRNYSEYILERVGSETQNIFKLNKTDLWEVETEGIQNVRKIQVNNLGGGRYSLSCDDLVYYQLETPDLGAEKEHEEFWMDFSDEEL